MFNSSLVRTVVRYSEIFRNTISPILHTHVLNIVHNIIRLFIDVQLQTKIIVI